MIFTLMVYFNTDWLFVLAGSRRDEGVFVASGDDCEGDEDVLSGMEASYFTEGQFDPNIFEMEGLEVGGNTTEVNLVNTLMKIKYFLMESMKYKYF